MLRRPQPVHALAHDAFISYSSHDKTVADAACAVLESRGIRCWIAPRDVTPGMDWGSEIIDAINGARVMVLVYSSSANESGQIRREVERGVHKGIPIVPFRIEDVPMSKSLEYFISAQHWLDALTPPLEQHLDYLARTVTLLLSRPGPIGETDDVPDSDAPSDVAPGAAPGAASATSGTAAGTVAGTAAGAPSVADVLRAAPFVVSPPTAAPLPHAAPPPFVHPFPQPAPAPGPPPPAPFTRPGASRKMMASVAAVVAVLAIGGYVAWSRMSPVDHAMIGHWSLTRDDVSGHWVDNLSIEKDGTYRVQFSVVESGTIKATGGRFTTTSVTHNVTEGTYIVVSPTTLETTSGTLTVQWTRQASSVDPAHTTDLSGIWDAAPIVSGTLVHQEMENHPDGTYRLVSSTEDIGHLTASSNRWRMASNGGRIIEGTYTIQNPTTLSLTGPTGSGVWTRQ